MGPNVMSHTRTLAVAIVSALIGAGIAVIAYNPGLRLSPVAEAAATGVTKEFFLNMEEKDFDMGNGVWHAWTFNGTVPGPTIEANQGDHIRVHVHNAMNITHSLHTHLSPYSLENDGSQLNIITGIGGMAMIPAGGDYVYDFQATVPGLLYYHCHSADGGYTIHEHIAQGLYGAILIHATGEVPVRDEVVFMSERGFNVSSPDTPFYIMNGKGIPGGEHTLETIFMAQGVPGIVAQLNKTVPIISGRVGEAIRINVVNMGDMIHSFHMHGMTAYQDDGRPTPAQVLGLVPGEAARLTITPTEPGLWLFHCHVVSHADGGMIGVFIVQPRTGSLDLPPAATGNATLPTTGSSMSGMDMGDGTSVTAGKGSSGELSFAPAKLTATSGTSITFKNSGQIPHTFTIKALGLDTGEVTPGATKMVSLANVKSGTYEYICNLPGHAD
ncbi:MAG: multicopper oxidase domain-containing protein, partial [Candidatus Thermoplasmatota archaeon]